MSRMRSLTEMLTIPTGSRNLGTSGYSSVTDSQFFFGSQFWPENSQGMSQDVSLSSRTSQQSSQEGSDPTFSNSYHTKPLLFGDAKDRSKPFSILHKFEEDKKKAKENTESEVLAKECLHFRETLKNIQQLVAGTEKNTAVCHTVLKKFNDFASALEKHLNNHQSDISQQFETLLIKVNSQQEAMREIQDRMQKTGDTNTELGSNVLSIKTSLECLREDQERDRNMLEEALKLLSTLVSKESAKPSAATVMDSVIQTSPRLEQPFSSVLQEDKLEGTQRNDICVSYNCHNQVEDPPQDPRCFTGKRKSSLRGPGRRIKRPLVLSQKSKLSVVEENCQSLAKCNKQPNISTPVCVRRNLNRITSRENVRPDCLISLKREPRSSEDPARCVITPVCCWSQDSNGSACIEVESILDKLSAESKPETPKKPGGLWELFDME